MSSISDVWVESKSGMTNTHKYFLMWGFDGLHLKVETYDLGLLTFIFEKE